MTKYFRRRKNISEPLTCYDCKQEKKDTKWFIDLNKEGRIICLVCRNKWYQQNYRPKVKDKKKGIDIQYCTKLI